MNKTDNKVTDETNAESLDKNDLNDISVQLASFFFLNNQEISLIRCAYRSIENDFTIMKYVSALIGNKLKTHAYPLYFHIFSNGNLRQLDWNTFFQFVIVFVFSPTTVLFYYLIHSFNNNSVQISLEDILSLLEQILNRYCSEETISILFNTSDLDHDDRINISKFYSLVTKSWDVWEPVLKIRKSIRSYIFKDSEIISILERRKNIKSIRLYKLDHHNSFPKQSCKLALSSILFNHPHRYRYDYECDEGDVNFSYLSIVYKLIEKNNPSFTPSNNSNLHSFLLRYLRVNTPDELSNTINNYFVVYCMSLTNQISSSQYRLTTPSRKNKLSNNLSQDYSNSSPSVIKHISYNIARSGSILKDPRLSKRIRCESLRNELALDKNEKCTHFSFTPHHINVKSRASNLNTVNEGNETSYVDI